MACAAVINENISGKDFDNKRTKHSFMTNNLQDSMVVQSKTKRIGALQLTIKHINTFLFDRLFSMKRGVSANLISHFTST